MTYVDGFVIPVPKKKLNAYKKMAQLGKKVWMEYGALGYFECVGDDLNIKHGASFSKTVKTRPGETVLFSFIIYKSKAHRNTVNKKVMSDARMSSELWKDKPMPFDVKRMVFGGFKTFVQG